MHKRRKGYLVLILAAIVAATFAGCGGVHTSIQGRSGRGDFDGTGFLSDDMGGEADVSQAQDPENETAAGSSGQWDAVRPQEAVEPSEVDGSAKPEPAIFPQLPLTGRRLTDFVPDGWWLIDSVKLDFNEDGLLDYVAVLQVEWRKGIDDGKFPRILFAVASDGAGQYRLDFQNANLIRTSEQGGVYGDPYLPLTAEGKTFTTHCYGGSGWRWSEDYTYEYIEGTWYLVLAEEIDGYGEYITEYSRNDWKSGVGIRKERNAAFSDMEEHWDEEGEPRYDLAYEMTLDEMPTLYQAGMRRLLAENCMTDWEVDSVSFAEGVDPVEGQVRYPGDGVWLSHCDENCVLYFSRDQESDKIYLVMYRWLDRKLVVLADVGSEADTWCLELYKDYIYYVSDIVEDIKYRVAEDGKERIEEKEETVGMRLNRMNLDGTGQMTILEYRYPGTEQEIMDDGWTPYMTMNYEISGDEIVAELFIGDRPHPYYRMNLDGTGQQLLGYVSK